MLAYFPTPYPDELFYSLCTRYAERMKYSSENAVVLSLFNTTQYAITIFLPIHLSKFIKQLPPDSGWTVEQIIDEHSLVPYVTAFLPAERVERLRFLLEHGGGGNSKHLAGLQGRLVDLPAYLRYCPRCAIEDRQHYSETYWRRLHQIPGVLVCPVHQVWLSASQIPTLPDRKPLKLVSADQAGLTTAARPVDPADEIGQILLHLAREYIWLGAQPKLRLDPAQFRKQYKVALHSHHLASPQGKIFTKKLYHAFQTRYPAELLCLLQCELSPKVDSSWLAGVIRLNPIGTFTLYHLLLIHFLGFTLAEFLTQPAEYHPFGTGPWPCLNLVCPNYRQPTITEVEIEYRRGGKEPIGIFACPTCGFIYTRKRPDQSPTDYWRRSHLPLAYGPLWEARLRELWLEASASYPQMAKALGVSLTTIINQSARLGLRVGPDGQRWQDEAAASPDRFTRRTIYRATLRERYRAEWLDILANEPELTEEALIKKRSRVQEWLYRDDPAWLAEHRPPMPLLQPRQVFDWAALDDDLCERVRVAAGWLRQQAEPWRRVTRAALEQHLGLWQGRFYHIAKLPRTAQVLAEVCETVEGFGIRRIYLAALKNCQARMRPARSTFAGQAGVAYLLARPLVADAFNEALSLLAQTPSDCAAIQARLALITPDVGYEGDEAGETLSGHLHITNLS